MSRKPTNREISRMMAEAVESGNPTRLQLVLVKAGLIADLGEAGDVLRGYELRQKDNLGATEPDTR